jgi:hypothetical protein
MREVDRIVQSITGVSVHDLPDFMSRDMYETGSAPADGAADVLKGAGYDFDEDVLELPEGAFAL